MTPPRAASESVGDNTRGDAFDGLSTPVVLTAALALGLFWAGTVWFTYQVVVWLAEVL